MFRTMGTRKGVTIAEITVALALVSVMATLVASFVVSINERTRAADAYNANRRDCMLIESVAEWWMNEAAGKNVEIKNGAACFEANDKSYTLTFDADNNEFVGTYYDETEVDKTKEITIHTETVKEVEFEILVKRVDDEDENSEIIDLLLICRITCENYEGTTSKPYIICVNPHVGEVYQTSGS